MEKCGREPNNAESANPSVTNLIGIGERRRAARAEEAEFILIDQGSVSLLNTFVLYLLWSLHIVWGRNLYLKRIGYRPGECFIAYNMCSTYFAHRVGAEFIDQGTLFHCLTFVLLTLHIVARGRAGRGRPAGDVPLWNS